mmetsp:Transcript_22883/g.43520  ORF Transcript_22883/g.43520 Transcript_22883/m.43520 type:complete len:103 (-) Transcript_22883:649-957(-)|eukprot:scaffold286_cov169-Amphora_coffeaeformis.AAC.15
MRNVSYPPALIHPREELLSSRSIYSTRIYFRMRVIKWDVYYCERNDYGQSVKTQGYSQHKSLQVGPMIYPKMQISRSWGGSKNRFYGRKRDTVHEASFGNRS